MLQKVLVSLCFVALSLAFNASHAQDSGDREVGEASAAPSMASSFAKDSPQEGLRTAGAKLVYTTPRGAFALSFNPSDETGCVFEWAGQGFDAKHKYLGYQGGFHFWKVSGWKFILAVRNQGSGGTFDSYAFINDSSDAQSYSKGPAYPARP
jgi:hypothetical protein